MKNIKKTLSVVLTLFLSVMFLVPSQTTFGKELNERTLYNMKIKLNDKAKTLTGDEKVTFKNKYQDELSEMVFHLYPDSYGKQETLPSIGMSGSSELSEKKLGDIEIKSVSINGKKASFTQDNQILKISLVQGLKPGKTAEVNIDFTLKIPNGTNRLGYFKDQYSLTNWYPILSIYDDEKNEWDENPFYPVGESNYSDSSDYEVEITVPNEIVVASTGIEQDGKAKNGFKKVTVKAENVRDFDFFMNKHYKVVTREVDGIKVNSYYIAKDDTTESTAKRMLNLACDSISFFNDTFGKYPFKEFDIAETYLSGGAMEYPTIIQMGKYKPMSEAINADSLTFFDEAVVHEVCHQWWYSTVGNNEFKESILDESFTSFSTALYFEKKFGEYNSRAVKASLLSRDYQGYYAKYSPIYKSVDAMSWNEFSVVVYKLGGMVIEDLRRTVGEEKFLEIFRAYYEKYKFKNATFEGFLSIVEEKSGSEVSEYIRDAFTSDNYDTSKLALTAEDTMKFQEIQQLDTMNQLEMNFGKTLSSLTLRGQKGQKIFIVTPSDDNLKAKYDMFVDSLGSEFDNLEISYEIITADKITKEIKESGNMLLVGDIEENSVVKEFSDTFPFSMEENKISLEGVTIEDESFTGMFAIDNKYNADKVVLVMFGNNLHYFVQNLLYPNRYNYTFSFNNFNSVLIGLFKN